MLRAREHALLREKKKKSLKAAKLRARRGKEEKVCSRKAHKLQKAKCNVRYILPFTAPAITDGNIKGVNAVLK